MSEKLSYEQLEKRVLELEKSESVLKRVVEALEKRIMTLSRPQNDAGSIAFEDLFNLDDIQRLQDEFASATGVASIITHADGTPITRSSNFCRLCNDIIRNTDKGRANCYKSDALIGRLSSGGPTIQPCMSGGLWDAGAAISVGGKHVANWLIGQVRDETQTEEKIREYAREIEADESTMIEAFREVPDMSLDKFGKIAQMLFTLANQLSTTAYQNVQQTRFIIDRKRAEEALRENEAHLRTVIETIPDLVWLKDPDGVYLSCNPKFENFFGAKEKDIIGKTDYDFVDKDLADIFRKHDKAAMAANRPIVNEEFLTYADASHRELFETVKTPMYDSEGKLIGVLGIGRNITERRQAEEALREGEERYRLLFNSANDAVFVHQPHPDGKPTKFLEINDVACRMYGYTREGLMALSPVDLAVAEHKDGARERVKGILSKGHDLFEIIHKTKDDIEFPVEVSAHLFDFRGTPTVLSIVRDITERKQAEQSLRESEIRFKALHNASFGGIAIHDKGIILDCNQGLSEITGYSVTELVGMDGLLLIAEKSRNAVMNNIVTGYEKPYEATGLRKNGEEFPVRIEARNVPYKGKNVRTVEFRDITERKQAEEERDRLISAIEQAAETIVITDSEGMIQYVNPAFEQITGYMREEAIGQNPRLLQSGEHDDAFYKEMWGMLTGGETWRGRITNKRKNGTLYTEEAVISPVRDASGRIVNYVAVKRDITKEMKLEEQLRQAQKMEAIGALAGGIAHDFNNILSPIIGFSEMLMEDLPDSSLDREKVGIIYKAAGRAGGLVKQILSFSRQSEHEKMPVRIQHILKEILKLVRSTIPSSIDITQSIQSDCGLVMADPTQLHQIAMNLITNAYHAVEERSGKIFVQLKETELLNENLVNISLNTGRYAVLSISDTGSGIEPAIKDKIFEPYFTTKKQGKGTGLGLAVVHGIVKEHGGDIAVYSEVSKGTTFNVYLPLMKKTDKTELAEKVEDYSGGDERILLVDDEKSILRLEKQMLERLGYHVTEQNISTDALATFKSNPKAFDLVVTDMTMPNMTGDQLSRELIAIKPDIPVIICTGFSERISKEKAPGLGIKGFLMKPVLKSDMSQMVRKVLDEAKGQASK